MMSYEKRVARRGGTLTDLSKPIEGTAMSSPTPTYVEPIESTAAQRKAADDIISLHPLANAAFVDREEVWNGIIQALAQAEARGARGAIGGNNPPSPLLPEKLIDPEALPELFAANYGPLVQRGEELSAGLGRWKEKHLVPKPADWPEGKAWPARYAIPDDADNGRTSNFVRLLTGYAGGKSPASGEVDEARAKVKKPILDAGKVVDGWFGGLRDGIRADVLLMDRAQLEYMQKKLREEQDRRDQEAAAAIEEANRKAAAAREADGADEAVAEAVAAEEVAETAIKRAEVPVADMTRTRTAEGTTTSLGGKWVAKVVDLMALVKAVATGSAPIEFLASDDSFITRSVQAKNGTISYPGIEISREAKLNRSGRTS